MSAFIDEHRAVYGVEPLPAESPLWDLPNVLISSRSASTVPSENVCTIDIFCDSIPCYLDCRLAAMRNRFDTAASTEAATALARALGPGGWLAALRSIAWRGGRRIGGASDGTTGRSYPFR